MKSILDPSFRYIPSTQTDVRKTFARVRRELRAREQAKNLPADPGVNVLSMRQRAPAPAR